MKYKLDMLYLQALDSRIEQSDFQVELRNKMLGFEGELAVNHMLNLSNQIIYKHDLEFVTQKQIQIDFLVVHNNQLSILEVKNYFGDFEIYETFMKNVYNHQYPSPFIQMTTAKNTLNQILYSNHIKIPINDYLIFPDKTFSVRTIIPHQSKVLLRSEFYKFPKLFQSYQIAKDRQLLQQICQLQTPFSHKYKSIERVDFSKGKKPNVIENKNNLVREFFHEPNIRKGVATDMNQYQQTILRLIYSGFSTNHIHKMLRFDNELKFLSFQNEFSDFIYRFGFKYNNSMDKYYHFLNSDIISIEQEIRDRNIQLVFSDDVIYPKLLKEIYDYPFILFCKGDIALLNNKKKLAIVGARNATTYTEQICNALIPELVDAQITIVSGMAKGADYFAHLKAIENGGHTIGVAAFGLDFHYPKSTRYINEWMRKHHLIVSEYFPSSKVQKWRFPERNRIISGLSQGVLVTEANNRSGSLITIDQALDQNRNVYCCPGSIFNELSRGVNKRIQEGAKAVQKAQDIIEDFNVFYD